MALFDHTAKMVLLALAATAGASAQAAETDAWLGLANNQQGLNGAPANTGLMVRLDEATGETRGDHLVERAGFALAWDADADELYSVHGLGGGRQALMTVNRDTLAVQRRVGELVDSDDPTVRHRISAMGLAPDGTLYGVSARRENVGGFAVPMGLLVTIDTETGVVSEVGPLGIPVYSRGGVVAEGAFQLVTNTSKGDREFHLFRVDLADGRTEHIGATGIVGRSAGVGVSAGGKVLAVLDGVPGGGRTEDGTIPERSHVYELDLGDARWSLVGDTGIDQVSGFTWMQREVVCGALADDELTVSDSRVEVLVCDGDVDAAAVCGNGNVGIFGTSEVDTDIFAGSVEVDADAIVRGDVVGGTTEGELVTVEDHDAKQDLMVHGGERVVLEAGTYFFDRVDLKRGSVLEVNGPVVIEVGSFFMANGADVNVDGVAADLVVRVAGHKVELKGATDMVAVVEAPEAAVKVTAGSTLEGLAQGVSIDIEKNSTLRIDACLMGEQ